MTNVNQKIWHRFLLVVMVVFLSGQGRVPRQHRPAAQDLPWSVRMADSEMQRRGDSFLFHDSAKTSWVYETAVFMKGLEHVWQQTGRQKYFDYIKAFADSYVGPDGSIKTYTLAEYNLDHLNPGKILLLLYNVTREEKYKKAAALAMKQLETQPRTKAGGFWHKKIYPWQMWLDGIYMAAPFYAEYAGRFDRPAAFDDVALQIILVARHTYDSTAGLFYHGWDESRQQKWADPVTGCSPNFWGRALGWYAMGIVDVLDHFPQDHPKRAEILAILRRVARGVQKYQDEKTGLWYQVLDQGSRDGNFPEASASAMFVYALAKAVRNGYLESSYLAVAEKGYRGILANFIKVEPDGLVTLTQICQVAGLGGKPYRDGSYEYYISTPVVSNDLKGVGPFLMASVEMERLQQAR
ncbi:MAG: glycoside hydrolase family 88 protein [candidate division KSB1 bacterium]|nr:glycoside hydrolase family 88 protein [candidate division KSB1 bacterium]MDZ7273536.1 glycoside hydrolase family 88 protein [candidate division KSB1 bacterium]MDZ7286873.1 glycoside hydrolase family 88 protein [candidate division KSB1 bacterium]MDZ7299774.1 glycoside hydrolase family 88 protein [candidate division KSB1 bacterium]MDZ7307657.1 glycoside hydrolase family 88 protein [candidate division KSB1 bacterium]